MSSASKFIDLNKNQPRVTVIFDGTELQLVAGQNLAAALLCAGVTVIRHTPVSDSPRSPYCMMGACYDCLVDIEGTTIQACMTEVHEGLIVNRIKPTNRQADE